MIDPIFRNIGIDANSHKLALVWKREGSNRPFMKTFYLTEGDSVKASGEAFRHLSEFFILACDAGEFVSKTTRVWMEAPVMGVGGPGATIPQAYVEGAVMAWAAEFSMKLTLVNNQSWKKSVLGNGNINKLEVTNRMKEVWPELVEKAPIITAAQWSGGPKNAPDQDLIDAGAVHLFGEKRALLMKKILRRKYGVSRRSPQKV